MRTSASIPGIGLSLLLGLVGCQREGLSSAGLDSGKGGDTGTGGLVGTGGVVGIGGAVGVGGVVGTGGIVGTGGLSSSGGRVGTGGAIGSGGTGGTVGKLCGGIAGVLCSSGEFCEQAVGVCSTVMDVSGTCVTETTVCPANYQPVCGCDGKTYANNCARQSVGVSKKADGVCPVSATACPADPTALGSWGATCIKGMICEYGTDPRSSCNERLTCVGDGTTTLILPPCSYIPPSVCPATLAAAAGQACTPASAYCSYSGLNCNCTNCTTGPTTYCSGPTNWHCAAPNADATCPPGMPRLGSACTTSGQTCTYACGPGNARACQQAYWFEAAGGPCPVSSRRAKKEIVYIGQEERQRLASKVLDFKLATYEYRDPSLAWKRHLGFIIEDVPGSPAVDHDGNMVDLYGYASMLVAAMQEQAAEVARLRAEVRALKRRTK